MVEVEAKLGSKHEYLVDVGLEFFMNQILNPFTFLIFGWVLKIIRHVSLLWLPIPTKTGSKLDKTPIRKYHWAHTKYHSPSSG